MEMMGFLNFGMFEDAVGNGLSEICLMRKLV